MGSANETVAATHYSVIYQPYQPFGAYPFLKIEERKRYFYLPLRGIGLVDHSINNCR
jgi:hypothetical protein